MKYVFIILIFLLSGCHHTDKNITQTKKDTILPVKKIDTIIFFKVAGWKYEWNHFVSNEIINNEDIYIKSDSNYKQDLLKLDSNYYKLTENQRISVWTLLFASIIKFESNFNPNCRFREDASLDYVYSEGLLQLSYGDETRFNIPLDPQKQNILDPETNLRSGVIIFSRQLNNKKVIFTKKHYYWSVLTNKQSDIINFFKKNYK